MKVGVKVRDNDSEMTVLPKNYCNLVGVKSCSTVGVVKICVGTWVQTLFIRNNDEK